MSDENIEGTGKKKPSRDAVLLIVVVLGVVIGVGAFLVSDMLGVGDDHSRYATGEVYEVTGRIVKADAKQMKGTRGTTLHSDIEIETDQELPDGTHVYASKESSDYRKLGHYADNPGEDLTITISKSGAIQEVRKAGSPSISEIGYHSDSNNENENTNSNASSE